MLKDVRSLIDAGFAIHLLKRRSKAPVESEWSKAPVASFEDLKSAFRDGMNVGVRLGKPSRIDGQFLYIIDLDIRDPGYADEAHEALSELFPKVRFKRFPTVQSGSGGESRHYYFTCMDEFRSKKLVHSKTFFIDADGTKHWHWEIELFGTGKQCALPPSIHPDTRKPYRWIREPDFDIGLPEIDAEHLGELVFGEDGEDEADPADAEPLGISYAEAEDTLKLLDLDQWCEDREGWRNVGMALHHEFNGSKEAFAIWNRFSKQSRKFDSDVSRQQWRSFRKVGKPIRMATLMAAAREAEITRAFDYDMEDEPDEETASKPTKKADKHLPDMKLLGQATLEAPPPPLDILGAFWKRQVLAWAENGSAPVDYAVGGLLAIAGSLIGNSRWVEVHQAWREPPVIWSQIIGPPSANKTPAFRPMIKVLDRVEAERAPLYHEQMRVWYGDKKIAESKRKQWEAIVNTAIAEGNDPPEMPKDCVVPPEPTQFRAYLTDSTIEATIRQHAANPRGFLMFRDEMSGWFANLERYSNGSDRPAWLEAYVGGSYVVDRVKDEGVPVRVPMFTVSMLGGIQPERLLEITAHNKADDGLQARFIPFWPENTYRPFTTGKPDDGHGQEALERLAELTMRKTDGDRREPFYVPLTEEAVAVFGEWRNKHILEERWAHERLRGVYGKANGQVVRIALILEYLWWCEDPFNDEPPEVVSEKAVRAAIKFREEYVKPMQKRVFGHAAEDENARLARVIAAWIVEQRVDIVNTRVLQRGAHIPGISWRTDIEKVDAAINYLVGARWLKKVELEKRGRGKPRNDYEVNSRVWDLLEDLI